MDYTPAADVELLFFGKCKCIDSVPVTPDGVPTPGRSLMSAMKAANIPFFVLNGGVKVRPHAPYFDVEGQPGEDIRTGRAVKNAERSNDRAVLAGKNLAKLSDYLVVGESISWGDDNGHGRPDRHGGRCGRKAPERPGRGRGARLGRR